MKSRSAVPSIEQIRSMYESDDLSGLQALNEMLAKRSNERMRQLEKYDFDSTAAYKRAQSFIDKSEYAKNNRFSRSKKMDIDSLYDQVKQEANFLRWQTSTVKGEMERREKVFDSLTSQRINPTTGEIEEPVINIPSDMDMDVFKKKFLKFLDSNAWAELKKHIYQANILNEAGEAIAAGADINELKQAITDYVNQDIDDDLPTIWENWTSVKGSQNEKNSR